MKFEVCCVRYDCFAFRNNMKNKCKLLLKAEDDCKFYKNKLDVDFKKIEQECKEYERLKNGKPEE